MPKEIKLLPIPDNPLQDLAELGKPLKSHSLKAIKKKIRQKAKEEVFDGLR